MKPNLQVGGRLLWNSHEVIVKSIEADRVLVLVANSDRVRYVQPSELQPLPERPDYQHSPYLDMSVQE